MNEKQRFLIYVHMGNILAAIRKNKGVSIVEAIKIALSKGILQKLEDIETGYYLESDAYLKAQLLEKMN